MRVLKKILFVLFLIVSFFYYSQKQKLNGTVLHNREYGKVEIHRDLDGVVYVQAEKKADSFYGLGYAQAQDRLFQMNLNRKIPQGKMSELFGEKVLKTDKLLRTMGLARSAKKMEKHLTQKEKIILQAYADGVNDYVSNLKQLPLEFQIIGAKFEEWKIFDTLCFMKLLNLMLTNDWKQEIERAKLEQSYTRDETNYIFASLREFLIDETVIMNDQELKKMGLYQEFNFDRIVKQAKKKGKQNTEVTKENLEKIMELSLTEYAHQLYISAGGSNAWVVSGKHTDTGKPYVCNDPHLEVGIPSAWHLAQISYYENGEKRTVSGGSMPGGAGYYNGQTNYLAFGLTTQYTDSSDLYYETIKDNQYLFDGKYYDLEVIQEKIYVKGQSEPIIYEVKSTNKGPLFFPEEFENLEKPVSWCWSGHVEEDTTFRAVYQLLEAETKEQIIAAYQLVTGPPQSIVWANNNGDIGFFGTGRLPIRKNIENQGYIQDGTKSENLWQGYVSKYEQPKLTNPEKGYIVVANNKISTDNIKNQISFNQVTTSRAKRITDLLEQKINSGQKLTMDDMKQIQIDTKDSYAEVIVPEMLKLIKNYGHHYFDVQISQGNSRVVDLIKYFGQISDILENWDYNMDKNQVAPTIYQVWKTQIKDGFLQETHKDEASRQKIMFFQQSQSEHFLAIELKRYNDSYQSINKTNMNAKWCQKSEKYQGQQEFEHMLCPYNAIQALVQTIDYLKENVSYNIYNWKYGKIHQHVYTHRPFSEVPILKYLYSRSYPWNGNENTVSPSSYRYAEKKDYTGHVGGNIRLLYSLEETDDNYWIIDTGNSENVFSQYYDNQMKPYSEGEYLTIKKKFNSAKDSVNRIILERSPKN